MSYNVTFHGGETAGSIGKVYSSGETAGSVGKIGNGNQPRVENPPQIPEYPPDTVSFHGGETAGSIGKVYSSGGETAGSIGKIKNGNQPRVDYPQQETDAQKDKVSFHGKEYREEQKMSTFTKIALFAIATAGVIGGLGYAHKQQWLEKIGNEKLKSYANKICEPCHNWCGSVKNFCVENYNKIKDLFDKNK